MTDAQGGNVDGGVMSKLSVVEKIIALLGAAGIAWTTFSTAVIQNQLKQVKERQEAAAAAASAAREEVKFQNEVTRDAYNEFLKAIQDRSAPPEAQVDRLTAVLVLTHVIQNPRQREDMAKAVGAAISRLTALAPPAVSNRIQAASFDADEAQHQASRAQQAPPASPDAAPTAPTTATGVAWSSYDFDLFWCDGPNRDRNQRLANAAAALRELDPKATGRWRVRLLPDAVNKRQGYQVKGYQIRYSAADELPFAKSLQDALQKKEAGTVIDVVASPQSTPAYLSAFFCG
jgi:hypothetical protein